MHNHLRTESSSSIDLFATGHLFHSTKRLFKQHHLCRGTTLHRNHFAQDSLCPGITLHRNHFAQESLCPGTSLHKSVPVQSGSWAKWFLCKVVPVQSGSCGKWLLCKVASVQRSSREKWISLISPIGRWTEQFIEMFMTSLRCSRLHYMNLHYLLKT